MAKKKSRAKKVGKGNPKPSVPRSREPGVKLKKEERALIARLTGLPEHKIIKPTPRQWKALKTFFENPDLSWEEIGIKAGYSPTCAASKAQSYIATLNIREVNQNLMLNDPELNPKALLGKLKEGLNAEVKEVKHKLDEKGLPVYEKDEAGKKVRVLEEVELPDYGMRHKYLDTAGKWLGLDRDPKQDQDQGQMNFTVLLGAGKPQEQEAAAQQVVAIRIQRGLHPTENRYLEPQEREQYIDTTGEPG